MPAPEDLHPSLVQLRGALTDRKRVTVKFSLVAMQRRRQAIAFIKCNDCGHEYWLNFSCEVRYYLNPKLLIFARLYIKIPTPSLIPNTVIIFGVFHFAMA
jgi:hypothetical protein